MKKLATCIALILPLCAFGQSDTVALRRNTFKIDFTSRWLYRQAYVVSYERVINKRRTFGLIAGYQTLPTSSTLGTGINVIRDFSSWGYKAGVEYRFYLAKENKFDAPHGVYLGPYLSFNSFNNEREISVDVSGTPENVNLASRFNVLNVGVQLGYQFVFNDRWTIDLSFMGPALAYYSARLDMTGNYTFDPDDVASDILDDLITKFPALGEFLTSGTATSQGRLDTWAYGFRYQVQVGYRFGKKK